METTEQKVEVAMPPDLANEFAAAESVQAKAAVLQKYAASRGAQPQNEKEAALMSADQFATFIAKMGEVGATQAKAAIEAMTGKLEERHNLNPDQAKKIAETAFQGAEQRFINQ